MKQSIRLIFQKTCNEKGCCFKFEIQEDHKHCEHVFEEVSSLPINFVHLENDLVAQTLIPDTKTNP